MIKYLKLLLVFFLILTACTQSPSKEDFNKWKTEIAEVEKAFNDLAQQEGLAKAFEFYAAPDGVIKRKNKVIQGKESIRKWYETDVAPNETLTWTPTFIEVSASGDLAYTYTYGDFLFRYPDTLGNLKENTGIFHTVWKRQADGNWRFVWD